MTRSGEELPCPYPSSVMTQEVSKLCCTVLFITSQGPAECCVCMIEITVSSISYLNDIIFCKSEQYKKRSPVLKKVCRRWQSKWY